MNEPEIYQIRVKGHLDDEWAEWFAGMTIVREKDGSSVLTGPVSDQSALQGLLLKIHDLALPLLSLKRIKPDTNNSILEEG
jgi:hypothetical protein